MIDRHAVDVLATMARQYGPSLARQFLELIERALPAIALADSLESELELCELLARRWGHERTAKWFAPLIRELVHFTPAQGKAIVAEVAGEIAPALDAQGQFHTKAAKAFAGLDAKTKAAFHMIMSVLWAANSYADGSQWAAIQRELDSGPVDAIANDPAWKDLRDAFAVAEVLEAY